MAKEDLSQLDQGVIAMMGSLQPLLDEHPDRRIEIIKPYDATLPKKKLYRGGTIDRHGAILFEDEIGGVVKTAVVHFDSDRKPSFAPLREVPNGMGRKEFDLPPEGGSIGFFVSYDQGNESHQTFRTAVVRAGGHRETLTPLAFTQKGNVVTELPYSLTDARDRVGESERAVATQVGIYDIGFHPDRTRGILFIYGQFENYGQRAELLRPAPVSIFQVESHLVRRPAEPISTQASMHLAPPRIKAA